MVALIDALDIADMGNVSPLFVLSASPCPSLTLTMMLSIREDDGSCEPLGTDVAVE